MLVALAGCDKVFGLDGRAPDADAAVPRCDLPAAFDDGLVPERTLYVAAGALSPHDGTEAQPFATLDQAIAAATPGTRILLAGGSYVANDYYDVHGTATAPIWIEGPTSGVRATFTSGLSLTRPQYVVVRHLDFAGGNFAFNALDGGDRTNPVSHHLVIDDVHATRVAGFAFTLNGVSDVMLVRSSCRSCARGVMMLGVHRAVIGRMEIRDTGFTGIEVAGGSDDIEIRQNLIDNAGERAIWIGGSSQELEFRPPLTTARLNYEASNIRVFDNVIHDGRIPVMCSQCIDSLFAANYVHGLDVTWAIAIREEHPPIGPYQFAPAGPLRVIDNVFEVPRAALTVDVFGTTAAGASTFANNLWLAVDAPQSSMPTLPAAETAGVYGIPSGYDGAGAICTGGAVGTGIALPEVTGTIDGSCRPEQPSIGPGEPKPGC